MGPVKRLSHQRRAHELAVAMLLLGAIAPAQQTAYERGVALFGEGKVEQAAQQLRAAVRAEPSARNWKALAVVYASAGNYQTAEPAFREACRLDSAEPDACYFHARALYALDRYEASLQVLQELADADPQPWRIYLGQAQALEALGRAGPAEEKFRKAVKLARAPLPDLHPRLHYGIFLFRQGRAEEALGQYEKAVAAIPKSVRLRYEYGRALLQLDRAKSAAEQLEKAVALSPGDAKVRRLLAKVYFRLDRLEDGRRQMQIAAQGSETSR